MVSIPLTQVPRRWIPERRLEGPPKWFVPAVLAPLYRTRLLTSMSVASVIYSLQRSSELPAPLAAAPEILWTSDSGAFPAT